MQNVQPWRVVSASKNWTIQDCLSHKVDTRGGMGAVKAAIGDHMNALRSAGWSLIG